MHSAAWVELLIRLREVDPIQVLPFPEKAKEDIIFEIQCPDTRDAVVTYLRDMIRIGRCPPGEDKSDSEKQASILALGTVFNIIAGAQLQFEAFQPQHRIFNQATIG